MAILGTMPEMTAPRPVPAHELTFQHPEPQRTLVETQPRLLGDDVPARGNEAPWFDLRNASVRNAEVWEAGMKRTPLALAPRDSCMRTLMVSRGWQTQASLKPALP
jgi:hypothetical protein